jgi:hypothetical protein
MRLLNVAVVAVLAFSSGAAPVLAERVRPSRLSNCRLRDVRSQSPEPLRPGGALPLIWRGGEHGEAQACRESRPSLAAECYRARVE